MAVCRCQLKRNPKCILYPCFTDICVTGASEDLPAPLKRAQSDQGLASIKSRVLLPALKEYFTSGDSSEVARCLQELNQPGLHTLIVTQVCPLLNSYLRGHNTCPNICACLGFFLVLQSCVSRLLLLRCLTGDD